MSARSTCVTKVIPKGPNRPVATWFAANPLTVLTAYFSSISRTTL
jgi:hypothetical protein